MSLRAAKSVLFQLLPYATPPFLPVMWAGMQTSTRLSMPQASSSVPFLRSTSRRCTRS